MSVTLLHPSIGSINGKKGDAVAQYLGIKYASIENTFAPSKLVEYPGSEVIDATKLGPTVIYPPKALDNEFGFIQKSLPVPELTMSELEGLNLNVTVPTDIEPMGREVGEKLPVFVFIHGGGFALGSNAWPQYDQARIVKLSAVSGVPVIGVGINYRVGLPGFLTSEEMRNLGFVSNNGIRDQANAFRWVQKYISGFGGDPKNVTFIGESAGSVSGSLLLHQKEHLFNKYISMSGTSLMLKPLPPPVAESVYLAVTKILGLEDLSGAERVQALTKISTEKLIEASGSGLPLLPVVDGDIIPCALMFTQISNKADQPAISMPGRSWCTNLLIGDCQFDGSILSWMLGDRKSGVAKSFCESIGKSLASQPSAAEKVQQAYQITPDLNDSVALRRVLQFATDIGFYAPVIAWAQGWPGKANVYHFNEKNPWDGEWKGEAGHVLDVAYLFQNYEEHMSSREQELAEEFALNFLSFMNGRPIWHAFEEGAIGAFTFGPSEGKSLRTYVEGIGSQESGRTNTIFELGEVIGLDELSAAWGNFLAGN